MYYCLGLESTVCPQLFSSSVKRHHPGHTRPRATCRRPGSHRSVERGEGKWCVDKSGWPGGVGYGQSPRILRMTRASSRLKFGKAPGGVCAIFGGSPLNSDRRDVSRRTVGVARRNASYCHNRTRAIGKMWETFYPLRHGHLLTKPYKGLKIWPESPNAGRNL